MMPAGVRKKAVDCHGALMTVATSVLCVQTAVAQELPPGPSPDPARWNLHGQVTSILQGYGAIRSPYQGTNSLPGRGELRDTESMTAYLGVRIVPELEFYVNPEVFRGFGLASTHGLGGFSNGEAQKGGSNEPHLYVARAFFRYTHGLGGEREKVADDINQLAGSRDVSRLTFTLGRFAVNDVFDQNSYAHDPRVNFMNYAVWAAGAFDYAADQKGYGIGGIAELNQKDWAFRVGYFRQPIRSNAQTLSWDLGREGQLLAELELRYRLMSKSGTLRFLGWSARSNAGSYRDALAATSFDPETSIWATRRIRSQFGYAVNLEQEVARHVGIFARWSWRDAASEVMSWTDMDRSLSAGIQVSGAAWGRPLDAFGLAGALNHLSSSHRDYTAAGGLGVTIGDGRLSYAGETIFETYYALGLHRSTALTFDYQHVVHPAYNSDRGPVSLYSARLRAAF